MYTHTHTHTHTYMYVSSSSLHAHGKGCSKGQVFGNSGSAARMLSCRPTFFTCMHACMACCHARLRSPHACMYGMLLYAHTFAPHAYVTEVSHM